MTEREFRAKVKATYPDVKIAVRTVSFVDLARTSRKCLKIHEPPGTPIETVRTINGWAREAGIVPDGNVRMT